MQRLSRLICSKGSILAYNAVFEIQVLNRCAGIFPEFQPWWKSTRSRFLDLLKPFRDFDYYAPAQHGSASMKSVMPAMCGVGYNDLAVQDGATASQAFLKATFGNAAPEERARIRKDLEVYCQRDTFGMILILRELKRLVQS